MSLSSVALSDPPMPMSIEVLYGMRKMLRSGDEKLLNLHQYKNTIDMSKWIATVVDPRFTSIIFPRVIYAYRGSDDVKYGLVAERKNNITCERHSNEDSLTDLPHQSLESLKDKEFFIVRVPINSGTYEFPPKRVNHVIDAYFFRKTKRHVWQCIICDPNYTYTVSEQRRKAYQHIANKIATDLIGWTGGLVDMELHRCINVNICLPDEVVGRGVCFTSLCATLLATAAYSYKKKGCKTGYDIMTRILNASAVGRGIADYILSAAHSRTCFFQNLLYGSCPIRRDPLLEKISQQMESRKRKLSQRDLSPRRIFQRPQLLPPSE